jgi:hypothetical protein
MDRYGPRLKPSDTASFFVVPYPQKECTEINLQNIQAQSPYKAR